MFVNTTSAATATQKTATAGSDELDKTAFLKLLMAQMQHQDPLEPMTNSEFVAQLAQFSSVEQLTTMNEGITLLGTQQMNSSNIQAASYIDKGVVVRSDAVEVSESATEANLGFTLNKAASTVSIAITGPDGHVIRNIEMQPPPLTAGMAQQVWDLKNDSGGRVPPGTYQFSVTAVDEVGNPVQWDPRVEGKINGVNYDNGYPELMIGSGIRANMKDVIQIYSYGE